MFDKVSGHSEDVREALEKNKRFHGFFRHLCPLINIRLKNISFCRLTNEDHKNEDCSLTYPNLKEERKQIDVVSGLRAM